tara:strand:+ start:952 stop:1575 length:624 start_codon:yes stop_codon:yes gene_type:complete
MNSFIKQYENQFPDLFCDRLVQILEDNNSKSLTHKGVSGKDKLNITKKDSTDLDLIYGQVEGVDKELYLDFDSYLFTPVADYANSYIISSQGKTDYMTEEDVRQAFVLLQPPKLKKYKAPDQGYHAWHQDYGIQPIQARRTFVAMVYLNDVLEGGETAFYHQNIEIKPQKGKMVIFPPYFTHMHRGNKPISNDKYICNFYLGINPNI